MLETENKQLNVRFTKMHGLGNDYVYIDCLSQRLPKDLARLARIISNRHTGIGSDGMILILPSEVADFKMRIFNADGSEAKMCGNGSRCVGKFVSDKRLTDSDVVTLETLGGIKTIKLHRDSRSGEVESATVDMGCPDFSPELIGMRSGAATIDGSTRSLKIKVDDSTIINAVGMGNPHGVVFIGRDRFQSLDIECDGRRLENHPAWTDRANIEFAVVDPGAKRITMRVWERGSGETMACGTGACATAVAAIDNGLLPRGVVEVVLPGGSLQIDWLNDADGGRVMMTGPATTVFEGVYTLPAELI